MTRSPQHSAGDSLQRQLALAWQPAAEKHAGCQAAGAGRCVEEACTDLLGRCATLGMYMWAYRCCGLQAQGCANPWLWLCMLYSSTPSASCLGHWHSWLHGCPQATRTRVILKQAAACER